MHPTKKLKRKIRKKSSYDVLALAGTIHSSPRQHMNFRLFKSDTSKKGNSAQAPSSLDQKILVFQPEDSPRSRNNVFNKVITMHNQLGYALDFHTER
jgi:Leucine-rich repeat (LRR) protein